MLKTFFITFLFLCASQSAHAQSTADLPRNETADSVSAIQNFGSRSIGHIVSPSSTMLKKNEIAIGTLFLGYGLTPQWMVGFSPFVYETYKMNNFESRWAWDLNSQERIIFGVEYFKTFGPTSHVDSQWIEYCSNAPLLGGNDCDRGNHPYGFHSFKMEAWDGKLTYSRMISDAYRLGLTTSIYYYLDDSRPFSLRMDPGNQDRFAANLTSLHEFRLNKNYFFNLEGGFWGMNYQYPYLHLGATVNVQTTSKAFLAGIGISSTFSPWFPEDKIVLFNGYDSRKSIHPELQVQYFF